MSNKPCCLSRQTQCSTHSPNGCLHLGSVITCTLSKSAFVIQVRFSTVDGELDRFLTENILGTVEASILQEDGPFDTLTTVSKHSRWYLQESLSILTAIFPGQPGLASYIGAKVDWSSGDNWSFKTCKESNQTVTANKPTPNFLQAGCPSCHPTNSVKAYHHLHHQHEKKL